MSQERWNLEKRLETNVPKTEIPDWIVSAIENGLERPIEGLAECEKTDSEKLLIAEVQGALNDTFTDLRLPQIHIDDRKVHIIEPADYYAHPKLRGGRGKTLDGHIYVQRSERPRFLRDTSHEIGHAASFRVILARYWKEQVGDQARHHTSSLDQRSGLSFTAMKPKGSRSEEWFEGLNEASIELLAGDLRERIIEKGAIPFTEEEKSEMHFFGYPHPAVLLKILEQISTPDHPLEAWKKDLYNDLFDGKYSSLKAIGQAWRQSHAEPVVPLLRRMDATTDSAIQTASALGFSKLAARLQRQLIQAPENRPE